MLGRTTSANIYPRIPRIARMIVDVRPAAGRRLRSESAHRDIGEAEDDSFVLEARRAEIEQQSTAAMRDAQIVDQLRHFDGANGVEGLQLDEDLAVADEIDRVDTGKTRCR